MAVKLSLRRTLVRLFRYAAKHFVCKEKIFYSTANHQFSVLHPGCFNAVHHWYFIFLAADAVITIQSNFKMIKTIEGRIRKFI
jgi:hypothetical protein